MAEHPAVKFLTAALARAENVARAVPQGPWRWEHRPPPESFVSLQGPAGVPVFQSQARPGNGSWIERHPAFDEFLPEPEAVLLLVAGARQILAEHMDEGARECRVCAPVDWDAEEQPGRFRHPADWPCRTVLLLAQAWGWKEEGS